MQRRNGWLWLAATLALLGGVALIGPARADSNNKGKIEDTKWTSLKATITLKDELKEDKIELPAGALKLEFGKDGKVTYRTGSQVYSGTYTLGDGDMVTLNFEMKLGDSKEHKETITIDKDKESLTMTDKDGTSLKFEKAK
jgi:hypothetical protein